MNDRTRAAFANWVVSSIKHAYVTAWSGDQFESGVSLLASIHRHDHEKLIFVGDNGFEEAHRTFVRQLKNVILIDSEFFSSRGIEKDCSHGVGSGSELVRVLASALPPDAKLLWVDPGTELGPVNDELFSWVRCSSLADGSLPPVSSEWQPLTPTMRTLRPSLENNFSGLRFAHGRNRVCAVLGNGPSLAHIDLELLRNVDTLGMNAAYRYWRQIGWYPKFYCCLDLVVGMSHKEAILDLVRHRKRYGIDQFLLRKNLFEWLSQHGCVDGVVDFDTIRTGFPLLRSTPITTGSHALAWAVIAGYDQIILAGVDCNYVEHVKGARATADKALEIVADVTNGNYFFDGYQQIGDRYNVPNPSKDLHLRSWHHVAELLPASTQVFNVSPLSNLNVFPKVAILEVLAEFASAKELNAAESVGDEREDVQPQKIADGSPNHNSSTPLSERELHIHASVIGKFTADVLLDETSTLERIARDVPLRQKVELAYAALPPEHPAAVHLRDVLAHAERKFNPSVRKQHLGAQ